MNKSNNHGFMLLETLIISAVILSTLIFLYVQFTSIKTNYDISFRYNTIPGLYQTKEITNYFNNYGHSTLSTILDNSNNGYLNISASTSYFEINSNITLYKNLVNEIKAKTILFVNDDLSILKQYITNTSDDISGVIDEELKRYILRLTTDATNKYRIIIEFQNNTFASVMIG